MEPANENTLALLPRVIALGGQAGAIERVALISERVAELIDLKTYGEAAQSARQARSVGSHVGSTKLSWRSCRRGSIEALTRCACAAKLWSIHSVQ